VIVLIRGQYFEYDQNTSVPNPEPPKKTLLKDNQSFRCLDSKCTPNGVEMKNFSSVLMLRVARGPLPPVVFASEAELSVPTSQFKAVDLCGTISIQRTSIFFFSLFP
jgi:hypothetical protein